MCSASLILIAGETEHGNSKKILFPRSVSSQTEMYFNQTKFGGGFWSVSTQIRDYAFGIRDSFL